MMEYNVNVCGCVRDTNTNFKCGFDITVENGGSVENVGNAIQGAIDVMSLKANPITKKPEPENKE